MTADRARELKQLEIWQEVQAEIDKFSNAELLKLRSCKPEDLKGIQDKIAVYEMIRNLPQIVIDREE